MLHQLTSLKKISLLALSLAVFTLGASNAALAQSGGIGGKPANPDPTNPRTQSIFIETIQPGASKSNSIKIVNDNDVAKTVLVYATDGATSSGGAFTCAQASENITAAGKWVTLSESSVTIQPNGSVTVPFTITVPTGAEAGELDACIVLQEKQAPSTQGGSINLSFRTGIRVAVLVPGNIIKQLSAFDMNLSQTETHVVTSPIVKNTGTVSVDATVTATLTPLIGSRQITQKATFPALRGQTMTWNIELEKPFWGGIYKAEYEVSYDKSSNFLGSTVSPPQFEILHGPSKWMLVTPTVPALIIEAGILALLVIATVYTVITLRRRKHIKKQWNTYTVGTEQLQDIAQKHHLNWKKLANANKLKAPYQLKEGQTIKVPSADKKPATQKTTHVRKQKP